jgi:Flp pilus assembly protein TadD
MSHAHAQSLVSLGRYAEARTVITTALAQTPDDSHLIGLLARCHIGLDDYPAALDAANRYVAEAPNDEWGHRLASIALDRMGRHDEALDAAERAVRLAPNEWQTHVQVALASTSARGRLWDGHQAACRAIELAPDEADAHFALGVVSQCRKHDDLARQAYRRALALDPQHATALNNLTVLDDSVSIVRSAHGYAESLRHEPGSDLVQANVTWLAARFVRRIYFAGLAALIVGLLVTRAAGGMNIATVVIGIGLLTGVVGYGISLGVAVPAGIRRFVVFRMRRDPYLICCSALTVLMLVAAAVTCLVPGGDAVGLVLLRPIGLANVALFVWTAVRASD